MRSNLLLMSLVLAASAAVSAGADTYYVACKDASASDKNVGTEALPFKTLGAAVAKVKPGDTVLVKGGVYREEVWLDKFDGGKRTERMSILACPGERPVLKGADTVVAKFVPVRVALRNRVEPGKKNTNDPDAWRKQLGVDGPKDAQAAPATSTSEGLDHSKAPFVGIYSCPLETYAQVIFADGSLLRQIGLQGCPAREKAGGPFQLVNQWNGKDVSDMKPGSFFYDKDAKRLYVWLKDGSDPGKHLMEVSVRATGLYLTGTWTVSGLDVIQYQDTLVRHGGFGMTGVGCIVENCRVMYNEFIGFGIQGSDCIVRGNEFAYNGVAGICSSYGFRMLLQNNKFHDNLWRGDVRACMCGNKLHNWKDSRFIGNHFENDAGLWLDINCNNAVIAENTFINCPMAIYFEISRWGVIANNVMINCGMGIMSYSADVLIAHNVTDSCGLAIVVAGYPRLCGYTQTIGDPNGRWALMGTRNNLVLNNLIIDAFGGYVGITKDNGHSFANYSDYNALAWTQRGWSMGTAHVKFFAGWDDYYGKLETWRMVRHQDEHSFVADSNAFTRSVQDNLFPNFLKKDLVNGMGLMDRAKGDYRLRSDSPMKGKGIVIPAVLDSPYTPCAGDKIHSYPFARTTVIDAPDKNARVISDTWNEKHYRLQPLPSIRPLIDLDKAPLGADVGLNLEWQKTGKYPVFKNGPTESADDRAWMVYDANRIGDGAFENPLIPTLAAPDTQPLGKWISQDGNYFNTCDWQVNMNLYPVPTARTGEKVIYQRVGKVLPNNEYILVGQMTLRSIEPSASAVGQMYLGVGNDLRPVSKVVSVECPGNKSLHWGTYEVHYQTGPSDPAIGQDLYIVLRGILKAPQDLKAKPDAAAQVMFDNFTLLSGEEPAKK